MKMLLFLIMLFIPMASTAYASQVTDWIKGLNSAPYYPDILKPENYKSAYLKYDFTNVMTPRSKFLGYIGPHYKRLRIHFKSITKIKPDIYRVKGEDKVGNNVCQFQGNIQILQVREYERMNFGVDEELKDKGMKAQGLILGKFEFKENPDQKFSGMFEGIMTAYWVIDKDGQIQYNDIGLSYSDSYKNNQYIGTWKRYGSEKTKVSNWGEYRIPFSDKFDIGAAEFSPDPKYFKQGWEDFDFDPSERYGSH